jgi:hypothetical protein
MPTVNRHVYIYILVPRETLVSFENKQKNAALLRKLVYHH